MRERELFSSLKVDLGGPAEGLRAPLSFHLTFSPSFNIYTFYLSCFFATTSTTHALFLCLSFELHNLSIVCGQLSRSLLRLYILEKREPTNLASWICTLIKSLITFSLPSLFSLHLKIRAFILNSFWLVYPIDTYHFMSFYSKNRRYK